VTRDDRVLGDEGLRVHSHRESHVAGRHHRYDSLMIARFSISVQHLLHLEDESEVDECRVDPMSRENVPTRRIED